MTKKKTMTREQAVELYNDLQKSMTALLNKKGMTREEAMEQAGLIPKKETSSRQAAPEVKAPGAPRGAVKGGTRWAIFLVIGFALAKLSLAALEASGIGTIERADAAVAEIPRLVQAVAPNGQQFSREEIQVLTALDRRRAELEERGKKLDEREGDIERRDREFATRLTQLREMTNALKVDREKVEKRKSTQLEQLANVYGSMSPNEAAALIEQLDVTIALALLEKMPEKRVGQILALMAPEKALTLTRMMSEKIG